MAEPFLAEIRIIGFNFAPRGWALCDGQILPINQNQSLYSLLGTTYGGDGRTTFALPDLRGRTPIHEGEGYQLGQRGGAENVTLTVAEMPAHGHTLQGKDGVASSGNPVNSYYGNSGTTFHYSDAAPNSNSASVTSNAGGSQAHNNMQPFQTLNFAIALQGLFPSRN